MSKVVTYGEIMLRLSPENYLRFLQCDRYEASFGGAEANVAVSLSNFGVECHFVSKLPEHEIGQAALNALRRYGVKTDRIVRGGERVGIYFCEKGASQRPGKVIYDRAYSAVSQAAPDEYDWNGIFKDADWFHFTGITPALSELTAQTCLDAVRKAKEAGVTVSCDLNFRKKLWTPEKAGKIMGEICRYVDYCIANEEDAKDIFGIEADGSDIYGGKLDRNGYESVAEKLALRFGFKGVAITLRESRSASDNNWSGMLYTGKKGIFQQKISGSHCRQGGRRRQLRSRSYIRSALRLRSPECSGICRCFELPQAQYRRRLQFGIAEGSRKSCLRRFFWTGTALRSAGRSSEEKSYVFLYKIKVRISGSPPAVLTFSSHSASWVLLPQYQI